MNIELIIEKVTIIVDKTTDYLRVSSSELIAYISAGFVYVGWLSEAIHMGWAAATTVVSYISLQTIKYLMKKKNILQMGNKNSKNKEEDE